MANIYKFPNATEKSPIAKRKKLIAAVAQDIVTSEDDDNVADAMDICNIIENHNKNTKGSASGIYALGNTIRNTLLEINEVREQNRERRHKELLQVLTKIGHHDCNTAITPTTECYISQRAPITKDTSKSKKLKEHPEGEPQHIKEYTVEGFTNDTLIETDELFNTKIFDDSTINSIKFSDDNGLCEVVDTKQLVKVQKTHNTTSVLKSEIVSTLKSFSLLQPTSTPPIIKPIIHANRVVPMKNKAEGDLQVLRAQMLEIQRKKMEDRERKKRELLEI